MESVQGLHLNGNASKMIPSYSIQKPCTEDWGKMNSEQQGRHCQVCCKTVVDFSQKSNSEIVVFLKTNSDKKVCGRFKSEQLEVPAGSLAEKKNSRYRIFFAALLFVFGGMLFNSCSSARIGMPHTMGDVAYVPDTTVMAIMGDTVLNVESNTAKTTELVPDCNLKNPEEEIPGYLMGDIDFVPDTTR